MILNEIPKIEVDKDNGYKYILVNIHDNHNNSKNIIFGNKDKPYHSDLFRELKQKYGKTFTYTCTGGGYINVDTVENNITLHGESTAYGPVDQKIVKKIFKDEYTLYTIIQN